MGAAVPRRRVLSEFAASVVVVVVAVEGEGRIGVVVVGESKGGPRSPRWRFTFTISRGLPIIMPAAPDT